LKQERNAGIICVMPRLPGVRSFLALTFSLFLFSSCVLAAKKKPPKHPVNINTATSMELQQVPGIGPATAEKILRMRRAHGPFKSVDELLAIKGIGKKRLAKMRPYLTVGNPVSQKRSGGNSARRVGFHSVWWVGLGAAMRRGT
jgi:competence ComEA-like helix-hairpin-helix protein